MSFSLKTFLGKTELIMEHDFTEGVNFEYLSDREKTIINDVAKKLQEIGEIVGGHVSVSAYGHVNPNPSPGDTVNVSVVAVPDPAEATPVATPSVSAPSAVPVENDAATSGPITPLSDNPLESANPNGNPAPAASPDASAGLTSPESEAPEAPAAPVDPPSASEVPTTPIDTSVSESPMLTETSPAVAAADPDGQTTADTSDPTPGTPATPDQTGLTDVSNSVSPDQVPAVASTADVPPTPETTPDASTDPSVAADPFATPVAPPAENVSGS
jgi:hypothetical protein